MNRNSRPSYAFSRFVGWGLTACVGLQLVAGVLAVFIPTEMGVDGATLRTICAVGFAGVCLFALAAGNCCAAHASAAYSHGKAGRHVFVPAMLLAGLFCGASLLGVDLGWSILKAEPGQKVDLPWDGFIFIASLLLAPAKPTMQWIVEGRIALDRAMAAAEDRAAIDLATEREARQRGAEERRGSFRTTAGAGLAIPMAFSTQMGPIPSAPILPANQAHISGEADVGRENPSRMRAPIRDKDRERFETLRELFQQGKTTPEILAQTGIPRTTGYRWVAYLRDTPLAA